MISSMREFTSVCPFSIAERIWSPVMSSHGVVMMTASLLCSRRSAFKSSSLSCFMVWERLIMMVPAVSTWLLKNSPKFFMYIFALFPSTTVTILLTVRSSAFAFSTALATSESFPTPEGSIMILAGLYFSTTSLRARLKSPTSEQQIQPEFISVILMPASFKNPPSIPISPNSFSMSTTCWPLNDSAISFLISVVFPAPRNPEIMSTFVIFSSFSRILRFAQNGKTSCGRFSGTSSSTACESAPQVVILRA